MQIEGLSKNSRLANNLLFQRCTMQQTFKVEQEVEVGRQKKLKYRQRSVRNDK